jgi:hypothetical protein
MAVASLVYTMARYALQLYATLIGRGAAAKLAAQQSPWVLVATIARAWMSALARLPEMWRRPSGHPLRGRIARRELARLLRVHRVRLSELALKD